MQAPVPVTHPMPRWQAPCLALGLHALVLALICIGGGHGQAAPFALKAVLVAGGPDAPAAEPARPVMAKNAARPARATSKFRPPTLAPVTVPARPAVATIPPSPVSQPVPAVAAVAGLPGFSGTVKTATTGIGTASTDAAVATGSTKADGSNGADALVYDASYRHKPELDYPWQARRMNQEGVAKVAVQVGSDGHPLAVRLIKSSGFGVLDEAAQTALKNCDDCFVPPSHDGRSVPGWALVPMVFHING